MPDNSLDKIRNKLYEEYEDSFFKLVMYDVAEKEGKLFLEDIEGFKGHSNDLPSKEALRKFNKQLNTHFKKKKNYAAKERRLRIFNRAAVAILVVIVILFTTVASVQALRIRVLNFFMDINPKYTSFHLKESNNNSSSQNPAINWAKAYVPTYIPSGYKISNSTNSKSLKRIIFENEQNKDSLIIYMELSEAHSPAVDTENASVFKKVNINGHEGTLVIKNSIVTIVWQVDNSLFTIQAPISEEIAIKMAQGVKYMN
jgi:hypothetical protein